jgi:AMMECR1 domain-containing protein
MPREWRGCIGCHEDREMVVPNIMANAFVKRAVQIGQTEGSEE